MVKPHCFFKEKLLSATHVPLPLLRLPVINEPAGTGFVLAKTVADPFTMQIVGICHSNFKAAVLKNESTPDNVPEIVPLNSKRGDVVEITAVPVVFVPLCVI